MTFSGASTCGANWIRSDGQYSARCETLNSQEKHIKLHYLKALEHKAASSYVVKLEATLGPPWTNSSKDA